MSLLEIRHLQLKFYDTQPPLEVVKDVSFAMKEGEILGIVGESGSGKTQTALSVLGLLKKHEEISAGEILFEGKNLAEFSQKELEAVRGKDISMIFQEPMTSLNPVLPVGQQVEEGLRLHTSYTKEECKKRALDMLREVELAEVENIYNRYPHQLSGGMRQRIMIAAALVTEPKLLIADEPTTALDVTIQSQILKLLKKINEKHHTGILFISHDLGVIRRLCDRVIVMNQGKIVEMGTVEEIFQEPGRNIRKSCWPLFSHGENLCEEEKAVKHSEKGTGSQTGVCFL